MSKIEVHVAGICARETPYGWKVLAGKRGPARSLHPGKWEGGGGQVHPGESFEAALRRQFFEEFGLDVRPWYVLEAYSIHTRPPQRIIPGVRYACFSQHGEVRLNLREFTEYKWLDLPVAEELDWIPGVKEAVDRFAHRLISRGPQFDEDSPPDIPELPE